ncbi:dienelactone hydrolase family protein [Thalassotalea fonticola]|uniref:Dienelactone hydrolase family protein n=1 Tax=Thalassotalea fonticola TaxID=3065649 RepID=A0ABZ0GKQ2_9GAMM|nr:dienelactone hydrolase family protein [Colwelliaceae bacterium S1-1]
MSAIVVSDVFGKTSALISLCEELKVSIIVDPYNGVDMGFKSEAEAYAYFIENVGFNAYLAILQKTIESNYPNSILIGFSVGASAIWALSDKVSSNVVKHAICYYGSQIRNLTEVKPKFAIELVFPKSEPHFDVLELQSKLSKKQNVTAIKVAHLHGFMNYYSNNYNQVAYNEQLKLLCLHVS